jgi:hypothetical protein
MLFPVVPGVVANMVTVDPEEVAETPTKLPLPAMLMAVARFAALFAADVPSLKVPEPVPVFKLNRNAVIVRVDPPLVIVTVDRKPAVAENVPVSSAATGELEPAKFVFQATKSGCVAEAQFATVTSNENFAG